MPYFQWCISLSSCISLEYSWKLFRHHWNSQLLNVYYFVVTDGTRGGPGDHLNAVSDDKVINGTAFHFQWCSLKCLFDNTVFVQVMIFNLEVRQYQWASYKNRTIAGCACARNPPRVSDPDMHHGTCMTYVPLCVPRSLTSGFLLNRWRGKRSHNPSACANLNFT